MEYITSVNNPLIKKIKSLKVKKYRELNGLFFIEGKRFVEEALLSGADIEHIIVSREMEKDTEISRLITMGREKAKEIIAVSQNVLNEISDTTTPQGILAVVKMKKYSLEDIVPEENDNLCDNIKENPCRHYVILDGIQDPGNMGTIIRTADAAGFNGVIVSKGCVDLYNPKVLRSTMGSVFHIPVYFSDDLAETLDKLKSRAVKIYASHLNATKNYYEVDMTRNAAIIIGSEANGISDISVEMADELIKIPMPGKAESLNASVAAGLLMYETIRQRAK